MGHETPVLVLIEGVINAAMLLPVEMREIAFESVPLYSGVSPQHGEEAKRYHSRATDCFKFVHQNIQTITDKKFTEHITDWQLWLRLMSPKVADVDVVREEIHRELESNLPEIKLIPFAVAFNVSFNIKSMKQYLNKRKQWGRTN